MTQKKYFGTDGIRGKVGGEAINPDTMTKLGYALGLLLIESSSQPVVLIGRDTRESGVMLELALQKGLMSAGASIILLGVLSTPAIAYLTEKLSADAAIVISASHNPYYDNGVKIIGKNGSKLSDAWEERIEEKMRQITLIPEATNQSVTTMHEGIQQYQTHCLSFFSDLRLDHQKIVLDCANGATSDLSLPIFSALGANVVVIHASPDGKNINAQCGATDVASLQKKVLSEKADCGIAFDGDGDRLIMVDHLGEVVDGDEILSILATNPAKKYDVVVGTLMSNLGLQKTIEARGMQFVRASVGDRYVLEKLKQLNGVLGGEGSGHIINLDYALTGDGVLTALQVLQIMHQNKKTLHDIKQVMTKRPQILINVPVKNPNQFSTMSEIQDAVKTAEKQLNGSGRVLLRASGTESCVRVMVECDEESQAVALAQQLAGTVKNAFG